MYTLSSLWPLIFRTFLFLVVSLFVPLQGLAQNGTLQEMVIADERNLSPDMQKEHAEAMKGDVFAQYRMGDAYYRGAGVKSNQDFGVYWLRKAAEQGFADAMAELGRIQIINSAYKNTVKGLQWLEKAAQKDASYASQWAYYLVFGEIYGIEPDREAAIKATVTGVKANDYGAIALLAYFYFVKAHYYSPDEEDYAKALQLANIAASQEHPLAYTVLSWLHYEGKVVPKDHKKAFDYAQEAAGFEIGQAMALLGMYYYVGAGTTKDEKLAAKWLHRAVAKGNNMARALLGTMIMEGKGVTKDLVLGYAYILLAAQHEEMSARSFRETLASKLTKEQRQKAQEQVLAWRQSWGFKK